MSMAMWDKKHQIQTIMSRRRKADGGIISEMAPIKPEVVKDADGELNHLHIAAQDILSAVHEKSAEALMRALVAFVDMYEHQPHKEVEEE